MLSKRNIVFTALLLLFVTHVAPAQSYRISLGSFIEAERAVALQQAARSAGLYTELERAQVGGRTFTRVLLRNTYPTAQAAQETVRFLESHDVLRLLSVEETWIRGPELAAQERPNQPELSERSTRAATAERAESSPIALQASAAFEGRSNREYGVVAGTARDAADGEGLPAVEVTNGAGYATTTDEAGFFALETPPGITRIHMHKDGFVFSPLEVDVRDNEPTIILENATVGSEAMQSGHVRFVLTWGELPLDLDLHLETPSGHHVYFGNMRPTGAGAHLDVDDVQSFGPETITITDIQEGEYRLWVRNYSRRPDISTSGATVRMFSEAGLEHTWEVPEEGTGLNWLLGVYSDEGFTLANELH